MADGNDHLYAPDRPHTKHVLKDKSKFISGDSVLDVVHQFDIGEMTIRQWLGNLLRQLWIDQETFSGKRPFGNSGWGIDPIEGLVQAGLIEGSFDEHGYLKRYDSLAANNAMLDAINRIANPPPSSKGSPGMIKEERLVPPMRIDGVWEYLGESRLTAIVSPRTLEYRYWNPETRVTRWVYLTDADLEIEARYVTEWKSE